ncbi:hypothetical protein L2E82_24917 [Cichorium intybus]|uniref:Uncharacterized protein n=1 Tax=Cichorium intybus TaxID=13427 RepID=A0ACB9E329_CICIN|nr:hypothetical protein L2E82_24917 [Cichorium intybus]
MLLDELTWRCILRKQLKKLSAIILGCLTAAILLEATILPSGVDFSLFSILINSVETNEVLVLVARYAPPISYNFLTLIHLPGDATTLFERNIFRLKNDADDLDGFDPSGLMIMQKERSSLEKGHKVGELVIPLARHFNGSNMDVESANDSTIAGDSRATTTLISNGTRGYTELSKTDIRESNKDVITQKYDSSRANPSKKELTSTSSLDTNQNQTMGSGQSSKIASTWVSMNSNFQNFKSKMEAKRFVPLQQDQDSQLSHASSSDTLDDIFERLKKPPQDDTM